MMTIDKERCINCGLCIKDCFPNDIESKYGSVHIKNETCISCGHCIAVCPRNAISTDSYDMGEVKEYKEEEFKLEADNLLNFIKFRRTVRQFEKKEVTNEQLMKIIEAGRYTQTASNSQNISYIVVKDGIDQLKTLAFQALYEQGQEMLRNLTPDMKHLERYANMWIQMKEDYHSLNKDRLFFHAPTVIIVVSDSEVNGSLASSNMELMTNALGLGTLFSGFFVRAAQGNKEIMECLGLTTNQHIVTCMVVGHPNVTYQRTVPRKKASITWL